MSGQMKYGIIISKAAGQLIPDDFLQRVLKDFQSGFGYAIFDTVGQNDEGIPADEKRIFCESMAGAIDLTTFNELQANAKDASALFFFANNGPDDGTWSAADIQPYVYEADGKVIVAGFIEGDFNAYDTVKGSTEHRVLWDSHVVPILTKAFKYAGGNIDNFVEDISDSTTEKTLLNTASHRGVFALLCANGATVTFAQNDLGGEFEWGAVSNTLGYSDAPAEPEPVKTPEPEPEQKKPSVLKRFSAIVKTSAPSEPAPPKAEPEKLPDGVHKVTPKAPDAVIVNASVPSVKTLTALPKKITVPPGLHGKKRKQWFRSALGLNSRDSLPVGWETMKEIVITPKTMKLGDLQAEKASSIPAAAPTPTTPPPAEKPEEKRPMVLPAEVRHKVNEHILKFLDNKSNVIPSPQEIVDIEKRHKSFTEQLGITLEEVLRWPTPAVADLIMKFPFAGALLFSELRRNLVTLSGPKVVSIDTSGNSNEPKKDAEVVDIPKKEEAPQPQVQQAQTQPTKRISFGGRR